MVRSGRGGLSCTWCHNSAGNSRLKAKPLSKHQQTQDWPGIMVANTKFEAVVRVGMTTGCFGGTGAFWWSCDLCVLDILLAVAGLLQAVKLTSVCVCGWWMETS